jgi:hypothetical protein
MIQHILTENTTGGKGISSFEICPFSKNILIRGTFTKDDLKEIIQIQNEEKQFHSKIHSSSNKWD